VTQIKQSSANPERFSLSGQLLVGGQRPVPPFPGRAVGVDQPGARDRHRNRVKGAEDSAVTMAVPLPPRRLGALIPSAVQRRIQFTLEHCLDERADTLAHPDFKWIEPVLAQQWNRVVISSNLLYGVISCGVGQIADAGSSHSGDYAPPISYQPGDATGLCMLAPFL
jgi:hypothetical protein